MYLYPKSHYFSSWAGVICTEQKVISEQFSEDEGKIGWTKCGPNFWILATEKCCLIKTQDYYTINPKDNLPSSFISQAVKTLLLPCSYVCIICIYPLIPDFFVNYPPKYDTHYKTMGKYFTVFIQAKL